MSSPVDILALADILRHAAKTEVLPRFRRLSPDQIRTKTSSTDFVTEADTAAERQITAETGKRWPAAQVIGEEAVSIDHSLLDRLAGAELAITVDPVDGTANYAAGLPLFAVMAAVVAKGEVIGGIIYDPMGDDWMLAEKGGGTWLRRPDGSQQRMSVAEPAALGDMVGTVSISFLDPETKPQVLANLAKVRIAANYRVAGHDYRLLASGHSHFAVFNKLMPWDHLPGTLLVEEAGGYVRRFDRSRYRPEHLAGGLLITPDEESWETLRREVITV
jgi:fructose-1,6-bisphosphatase/inositol monophosphatase family enzyme